jgi:cyclophilin family peptidyl-prolyl cis-trans isomerase
MLESESTRGGSWCSQTGDPEGPEVGFVDPSTGKLRTIPLEVFVPGDKIPVYSETLEELGRSNETPALPFNAYGTLAMARTEFETDSASSQVS